MLQLNCFKAVSRVRRRISDLGGNVYTAAQVLEALDEVIQSIYTTTLLAGQQQEMDMLNVPRADFTEINTEVVEYSLPETVGEIRLIEGVPSGSSVVPVPLLKGYLGEKEYARGFGGISLPVWFFSKFGRPGRIQIRGRLTKFTSFNIWHARKWAPLHYAIAEAGGVNTLTFNTAPTGDLARRDDVYIGMDVEITADTAQADNVGALGRVIDYVGNTRVATFEANWPAATSNQTTYAIVLPVEPENSKLIIEMAAHELFMSLGEPENLKLMEARMARLEERFISNVNTRHSAEPKRFHSSRSSRF
jgi:hypothetical protein